MRKTKKMTNMMRPLMGLIAAGTLASGCLSKSSSRPDTNFYTQNYKRLVQGNTASNWEQLEALIAQYAPKSPSANKLFNEILACHPQIFFVEVEPDEEGSVNAGEGNDEGLWLNMNAAVREVMPLCDTFFHEGEHVVHMTRSREYGINAVSFASLDDVFCYNALIEALAERKAALCRAEIEHFPMKKRDRMKVQAEANDVFMTALCGTNRDEVVQNAYVIQTMKMVNTETNVLPNQVYFKENPDWDKIATLLSRGEVTKMPILPTPTLQFVNLCLLREIQKHPDAKNLNEFDLSCTLANSSTLKQDEPAIKRMISDMLLELVQGMPPDSVVSQETSDALIYWMGLPDENQQQMIDAGQIDFRTVRDFNLEPLKTKDMFEAAETLIQNPEIQAFGTMGSKYFGRILHFGKQILLPQHETRVRPQQKTR